MHMLCLTIIAVLSFPWIVGAFWGFAALNEWRKKRNELIASYRRDSGRGPGLGRVVAFERDTK